MLLIFSGYVARLSRNNLEKTLSYKAMNGWTIDFINDKYEYINEVNISEFDNVKEIKNFCKQNKVPLFIYSGLEEKEIEDCIILSEAISKNVASNIDPIIVGIILGIVILVVFCVVNLIIRDDDSIFSKIGGAIIGLIMGFTVVCIILSVLKLAANFESFNKFVEYDLSKGFLSALVNKIYGLL